MHRRSNRYQPLNQLAIQGILAPCQSVLALAPGKIPTDSLAKWNSFRVMSRPAHPKSALHRGCNFRRLGLQLGGEVAEEWGFVA
jgi:hypothetical protein